MGWFGRIALAILIRQAQKILSGEVAKSKFQSFIRHVLTTAGGALVTKGIIDGSQLETLVGLAPIITGFIWANLVKSDGVDEWMSKQLEKPGQRHPGHGT